MTIFYLNLISVVIAATICLEFAATHKGHILRSVAIFTGLVALLYVPGYLLLLSEEITQLSWSRFYIWIAVTSWLTWWLPFVVIWRRR